MSNVKLEWISSTKSSPDRDEAMKIDNGKDWITNAREARTAEWNEFLSGLTPIYLWQQGAPGFKSEYEQRQPAIYAYPGIRSNKAGAILISAGGGWMFKSLWDAEPIAKRFYELGFATFIVDYRVAPYTMEDSMNDAIRSVRFLRYHAEELKVLPDRICVLGGSAGGGQSAMAATMYTDGDPLAEDPVERISSRPDACVLSYGAWITEANLTSVGEPFDWEAQKKKVKYSPAHHLKPECPPFFVWQTNADDPRNGCAFCTRLTENGIPFEFHIFPENAHGCGLADGKHKYAPYGRSTSRWSIMAAEFLENLGFLE